MLSYPVNAPIDGYRGQNSRRLAKAARYNRVAVLIADAINADLATQPENACRQYYSASLAHELREDSDLVHEIIFEMDCGHNGVTVVKGSLEIAQAEARGFS